MIEIFDESDGVARAVAEDFVACAASAISERGRFSVALAGGSTPRTAYELLATPAFATRVGWDRVHVFWGDERSVPPTDAQSNYRMAHEALLHRVPIPAGQVWRIEGEREPVEAAAEYEIILRTKLGQPAILDLVLLGLGDDGHTASIFPGQPVVHEAIRLTAAASAPKPPVHRVTLTPVAINAARRVSFMVSGSNKAATLARVLEGPRMADRLPAQIVAPIAGDVVWFVDRAAAAGLRTTASG